MGQNVTPQRSLRPLSNLFKYTDKCCDCQETGLECTHLLIPQTEFLIVWHAFIMNQQIFLEPSYKISSDHSLLVKFGDEISLEMHQHVLRLSYLLSDRKEFILNIHPAYSSVLITFDPIMVSHFEVEKFVRTLVSRLDSVSLPEARSMEIPVCYGSEFGPDLADVGAHNQLTPDEVVQLHSSGRYLVYFLGFAPGFPYMGGMDNRIATPRLPTPRTSVPAGSVAIGGSQTGIYPLKSPGGWRIIGRTPLSLFDPLKNPLTLFQMGDVVQFRPIQRDEFDPIHSNRNFFLLEE